MNKVTKLLVAISVAAPPILLWDLAGPTVANAYEYCRMDVTGHMTSCSFDTMEQCEATRSGIGGDCFRDPFLKDSTTAYARGTAHAGSRQERASGKHHR